MAKAKSNVKFNFALPDEGSLLRLRAILDYESDVNGHTIGQTAVSLILGAVDIDSYPDEVRARIGELLEQIEQHAIKKALEASATDTESEL